MELMSYKELLEKTGDNLEEFISFDRLKKKAEQKVGFYEEEMLRYWLIDPIYPTIYNTICCNIERFGYVKNNIRLGRFTGRGNYDVPCPMSIELYRRIINILETEKNYCVTGIFMTADDWFIEVRYKKGEEVNEN